MAYLLNNKKILGIVIGVLLAVITLAVTVVAVVANAPEKDPADVSQSAVDEPQQDPGD